MNANPDTLAELAEFARNQLGAAAVLLAFRMCPVACYALGSRVLRAPTKGLWAATFAATVRVAAGLGNPELVAAALALLWFLLLVPSVWVFARLYRRGAVPTCGVAVFCLLLFGCPALLIPGPMLVAFLIVGWDVGLSSYSYCLDVARRDCDRRLAACAFFLLVDPTLVYHKSASRARPRGLAGSLRVLRGLGLSLGAGMLVIPLSAAAAAPTLRLGLVGQLFSGAALTLGLYMQHAGLAGLQIGLMRAVGRPVPERYVNPLGADSVADFWRRWNTYLANWIRPYVFLPLARRLRRRSPPALVLICTFGVVGGLHDLFGVLSATHGPGLWTLWFLAAGTLLALTLGMGRLRRLVGRAGWPALPERMWHWGGRVGFLVSWVVMGTALHHLD